MRPRRPPGAVQSRHADDWLITYADTITLLLCMLLVLLALHGPGHGPGHGAGPHAAGFAQSPPAAAAAPPAPAFPPPPIVVAPPSEPAAAQAPVQDTQAEADGPARTWDTAPPDQASADTQARPADSAFRRTATNAPFAPSLPPAGSPSLRPLSAGEARQNSAEDTPPPGGSANADAPVSTPPVHALTAGGPASPDANRPETAPRTPADEPPGDRITIFQCSDPAFFASGSAVLSEAGQDILAKLLGTLQASRFAGYRITVEGHTDDDPIRDPLYPSNWELSSARAASVVRFLVNHGIAAQRLRAAGYADTRPLAPNRDAAGNPIPQNQARNRRVVVELERIDHQSAEARR